MCLHIYCIHIPINIALVTFDACNNLDSGSALVFILCECTGMC